MKSQRIVAICVALLSLLAGKLGIDIDPQNFDLAKFLSEHLGELLGGMGGLGAILAYFLQKLKLEVSPAAFERALEDGTLDLDGLLNRLRIGGSAAAGQMGQALGAASADVAFVRLFHHCEFDSELTDAVNAAHSLYRSKRAQRVEPKH
jgi:hypothetical protein